MFGISTQARTGIIYLEGRGTNHCTILTVILLYLVITRDSRVKGIEPLLTILEIVALTVILHSFPHLFTFLLFFTFFFVEKKRQKAGKRNQKMLCLLLISYVIIVQ